MAKKSNWQTLGIAALTVSMTGCASGSRFNPFASWSKPAVQESLADTSPTTSTPEPSGITGSVGNLAKGARGQVSTMGLAVKSAYSKTTSTLTGFLTPGKEDAEAKGENDPLSLSNKPKAISAEVFVTNGQVWETTGNLDKAMEQYTKALEAEPQNPSALASVARLHEKREQHAEAVDYFNRALKVAPNDASLYNDLGLTYSKMGKHAEAVEQLQRAIAIAPSTTRYANNLAVVQMNGGQTDNAMQTLLKAHEPAKAHYNMAWMYYQRQDVTSARTHLGQALQIDPSMDRAKELMDKIGTPRVAEVAQNVTGTAQKAAQAVDQYTTGAQQAVQSAQGYLSSPPSLSTPTTVVPTSGVQGTTGTVPATTNPATKAPATTSPATTTAPAANGFTLPPM